MLIWRAQRAQRAGKTLPLAPASEHLCEHLFFLKSCYFPFWRERTRRGPRRSACPQSSCEPALAAGRSGIRLTGGPSDTDRPGA